MFLYKHMPTCHNCYDLIKTDSSTVAKIDSLKKEFMLLNIVLGIPIYNNRHYCDECYDIFVKILRRRRYIIDDKNNKDGNIEMISMNSNIEKNI